MAEQAERKIHRSPNHPFFGLKEAADKIRVIYEKEKRSATAPDVIVRHLGYSALNGPGGRTLSGLRQYGLLEESGGRYRVSDDAYAILHYAPETEQRRSALKRAALAPSLYRELHERFPDLSASDDTLEVELLDRKFNPEVIGGVIANFRSTMQFAGIPDGSYNDPKSESKMDTELTPAERAAITAPADPCEVISGSAIKTYQFAFAGDGRAEFKVYGDYSTEDLEDLKTYLDVTLRGLIRSKRMESVQ